MKLLNQPCVVVRKMLTRRHASIGLVGVLIVSALFARVSANNTRIYFETIMPDVQADERNAIRSEVYKWPHGVVPFIFHENLGFTERNAIVHAMHYLENATCVRFVQKSNAAIEHIRFVASNVCGANIGFRPNRTRPLDVMYSAECVRQRGAIQHELLHVLGLLHEQCRPDRDEYVRIRWENIEPKFYSNFEAANKDAFETFGLPYDYGSLMHYPKDAFAKSDGVETIVAKTNATIVLGQLSAPSFYDLEKVRRMYHCVNG